MNVREAIKALADGHRVVDRDGDVWEMGDDGEITSVNGTGYYRDFSSAWGPFAVFHIEPATDEELIAELERLRDAPRSFITPESALAHCLRMLKARKVKP